MSRLATRWERWVALWSRQERPDTLALLRILLCLVLLTDQIEVFRLGLVEALWAPSASGGIGDPMGVDPAPMLYRLLPATAETAWIAFGLWTLATVLFGLGVLSRISGIVLVLLYAQLALVLPGSDRGIDMLMRNALLVLALSPAGEAWSIDARIRNGRWRGAGVPRPAWARHLLVLQLGVMYFTAGVQKVSLAWLPMGDFSALYIVLHDPAVANTSTMDLAPWYWATQISTAGTMLWEWSAPLFLLSIWYRDTRTRRGRLRAWMNRVDFRLLYLLVGVAFHTGIHVMMHIGIFPWAMMALYLCAWHPDELAAFFRRFRLRGRGDPRSSPGASGPS